MGRRLRSLVSTLKDKASLSSALLCHSSSSAAATTPSATSSPLLAVLRATTHHPSPCSPRCLDALLTFGNGSRLAAAACTDALLSRLRSTRDPSVALKSLLAAHHLLTRGSFLLRDHLISASLNPLNLSSFRDASSARSWALSDWVRWLARLLETLISAARLVSADDDRIPSLQNGDILIEIDALVTVVEEVAKAPDATVAVEGSLLVAEAVRIADEDRLTAERRILVRVREMGERLGLLRFSDLVQLGCLVKRLEECRDPPVGGPWRFRPREWLWSGVESVMGRVRDVVVREERVIRDEASQSARVTTNRVPLLPAVPVRSGSLRLEGGGPLKL